MGQLVALPTAAEFQKWMRPSEALARLPAEWPSRTKQRAIMTRIADGSILAVARSAILQRRGRGNQRYEMTTIDPKFWAEPFVTRDGDFWVTGDLGFDDTPPMQLVYVVSFDDQPRDEEPTLVATFRDVRIDPASFAREFAADLRTDAAAPVEGKGEAIANEPTSPAEPLSAEEFSEWLTPKAALAAVPSDIDAPERRAWITRRLREGHIIARAETAVIIDINGRDEASRTNIGRHYWNWRELGDWFSSGDLEVTTAPEEISAGKRLSLTAYRYDQEKNEVTRYVVASFLGVRLDPSGFPAADGEDVVPPDVDSGRDEAEADHQDKPRLPDAWLKQWHQLFVLAYPDGSIELARQSVAGMFPRHHVSRDRVRELFPNRTRGRPRKSNDNS